jgi:hypothetical protein
MKVSDLTEAALAVLVVGGIVGVAAFDAIAGKPVSIPPELYGFGGIVIGAYFRGRSVNGTVAGLTAALQQSTPVAPAEPLVPHVPPAVP